MKHAHIMKTLPASAVVVAIGIVHIVACGAVDANQSDSPRAPFESDSAATAINSNDGGALVNSDLPPDCAPGADAVYTVDADNHIYRFDPPSKTFQDLGALNCPANPGPKGDGVLPFSMGIDRKMFAWVLYRSSEVFKVDLNNRPLSCTTKTTWTIPRSGDLMGMALFGMGFSTDTPGGTTESLFINGPGRGASGGLFSDAGPTLFVPTLAKLDPLDSTLTPKTIGSIPAWGDEWAEMTGNGNAELWGFKPDPTTPHVVQFDKTNAALIKDFPEPALARRTPPAYAFAHWGGDYWVFIAEKNVETTTVYQIDKTNGAIKSTTPNTGRIIVGAGVSTCAPILIK